MMYIHSNNEIDKRINISKIANNISTMGDDSMQQANNSSCTAYGLDDRLIVSNTVAFFIRLVIIIRYFTK